MYTRLVRKVLMMNQLLPFFTYEVKSMTWSLEGKFVWSCTHSANFCSSIGALTLTSLPTATLMFSVYGDAAGSCTQHAAVHVRNKKSFSERANKSI